MVAKTPAMNKTEKTGTVNLPVIDLAAADKAELSKAIVKACEGYGFFRVINHGVAEDVIARLEEETCRFFAKPMPEKQRAGPASPCGYGCRSIGLKGDNGELEYLLLSTNPVDVSQRSETISEDPAKFRSAVMAYTEAMKELACQLLDLMSEGLRIPHGSSFSRLVADVDSDSLLRINHYPTLAPASDGRDIATSRTTKPVGGSIGFGEHTDPQILTLLRSNDVGGFQISVGDGVWVPVPSDPSAFCANVGDALQAMTNGRFMGVRHRVVTDSTAGKARMSMTYFAAPPSHAKIEPLRELVAPLGSPSLYRAFTWSEYKQAMYSLRLGDTRINRFKNLVEEDATS